MKINNDQKYFVIEEIGNVFRISDILIDQDKNIKLLDIKEVSDFDKLKAPKNRKSNIILALNSSHATTIEREIKIKRSCPHHKINEGEMDQLVFKSLWVFLDEYRNWSAQKMNIVDLNVVLSGIEIKNTSLDSKNVLNPIGFKGENITFKLRGTLIPRDYLEYIEKIKDFGDKIKVVERLSTVAFFCSKGDFQVHVGPELTEVFSFSKKEIKYKKKYAWGTRNIVNSIVNLFLIERKTAVKVIKKYFNGEVSKKISKIIDKKIKNDFELFQKDIKNITKKRKVKIFVNIPFPMYKRSLSDLSKTEHLDLSKILETKGFNVIIKLNNKNPYFRKIPESMILAEAGLFSSHYGELNKMLKRRSRWLVPHI